MLPSSHFSRPGLLEKVAAMTTDDKNHATEAAGLGVLAIPSALQLAGKSGVKSLAHDATTGGRLAKAGRFLAHGKGEQLAEIGGLGILAAPAVSHFMHRGQQKSAGLDPAHLYYFFHELKNPSQE